MKAATRFVIEGEWSGYRSGQARIVHRQVYPAARRKLREWAAGTHSIRYTDGTLLYLTVRDCRPRERVKEIKGYASLIEDCFHRGVSAVEDLP